MAYSKADIKQQLKDLGIHRDDTVLVHSSMKAIGEVEGRAETVLDAFIEYLSEGLLIFPTHTWKQINEKNNVFDPATEPSLTMDGGADPARGVHHYLWAQETGSGRIWTRGGRLER